MAEKDNDTERCQMMFRNLLCNTKEVTAPYYYREILRTATRCSNPHMDLVKECFQKQLGKELEMQFLKPKLCFSVDDEVQVTDAVNHYASFCDKQLYLSLSWENKARFQILDRPQHILDALGIFSLVGGAGYGASKAARASFKALRARQALTTASKKT